MCQTFANSIAHYWHAVSYVPLTMSDQTLYIVLLSSVKKIEVPFQVLLGFCQCEQYEKYMFYYSSGPAVRCLVKNVKHLSSGRFHSSLTLLKRFLAKN